MTLDKLLYLLKTVDNVEVINERREEIAKIIPAIRIMFDYDQMNKAHQYDLWMHCLHVVCGLPKNMNDSLVYLAALLHDIGKPASRCKSTREGDLDMHYYGHPKKSAQIVRDEVIPILEELGFGLSYSDAQRLLYYVEHHDDRVSVKLKHVRKHTRVVPFEQFQNLMMLQVADAKAHVQLPIIVERIDICSRLAGEDGERLYQRILEGE